MTRSITSPLPLSSVSRTHTARQSGGIWKGLLLLGSVVGLWIAATPVSLSPRSLQTLSTLLLFILPCLWAAVRLPHLPRLQLLATGALFLLIAWPVLRLYNHLTMTLTFPLADDWLAGADSLLGFDWLSYARMLDSHPGLLLLMDLCYGGLTSYSLILYVLLLLGNNARRNGTEFIFLFFATAFICSTIGMLVPAVSASIHYAPSPALFHHIDPRIGAYHLDHLMMLRTNPAPMLNLQNLPGMVSMPSFHTAMGLIAIYCTRHTPWLLGPSVVYNMIMLASTPLYGSHYLVDLLAGAIVAGSCILILRHDSGRAEAAFVLPFTARGQQEDRPRRIVTPE